MPISTFDIFSIGIGPSSSHTVGPMRAIVKFLKDIESNGNLKKIKRIKVELYGSLAITGKGHGTDKALILGIEGEDPKSVDIDTIDAKIRKIRENKTINLLNEHPIEFLENEDLIFNQELVLQYHPNGMTFIALDQASEVLQQDIYYSIGGGFFVDEAQMASGEIDDRKAPTVFPFNTSAELLKHCKDKKISISDLMYEREKIWRTEEEISAQLMAIWHAMEKSIENGLKNKGTLPGGLNVRRRAPNLHKHLIENKQLIEPTDPLSVMDWVSLYAIAVNEENAAGGRVVTAPTNGSSGLIPAVLYYAKNFIEQFNDDQLKRFLLTSAAICILYKKNASLSGADVGCQGEVGVACSMASGALAEFLGATVSQVDNAAAIGMQHNLGLTCDPVMGLVQIPCIERNAIGAVKAINAARLAIRTPEPHIVSLDSVVKTMFQTGKDMMTIYKETSQGGLAVNVIEC